MIAAAKGNRFLNKQYQMNLHSQICNVLQSMFQRTSIPKSTSHGDVENPQWLSPLYIIWRTIREIAFALLTWTYQSASLRIMERSRKWSHNANTEWILLQIAVERIQKSTCAMPLKAMDQNAYNRIYYRRFWNALRKSFDHLPIQRISIAKWWISASVSIWPFLRCIRHWPKSTHKKDREFPTSQCAR